MHINNVKKLKQESLKRCTVFAVLLFVVCLFIIQPEAALQTEEQEITVLFTNDLNDQFLPREDTDGTSVGGYARLATALSAYRGKYPNAVTVDAGNFSGASLFRSIYTTKAPEFAAFGLLGYDAVAMGRNEFAFGTNGIADMFYAAKDNGGALSTVVMSNITLTDGAPQSESVLRAMSRYGVKETLVFERGGVTYGVFALLEQQEGQAEFLDGFASEDMKRAARRSVETLQEEGAQVIIALINAQQSTAFKSGEQIAKSVDGIDLIVMSGTGLVTEHPTVVDGTYIVAAGADCSHIGCITLTRSESGEPSLVSYELLPIDETIEASHVLDGQMQQWKAQITTTYLSRYGYAWEDVLTRSVVSLEKPSQSILQGSALGDMIADAFLWKVKQSDVAMSVDIALVTQGEIQAGIGKGAVTVNDVITVLPSGVGTDGAFGDALVSFYLDGREVKTLLELDGVAPQLFPTLQLYCAGVTYETGTRRVPLNRVLNVKLTTTDEEPESDRLYHIVCGRQTLEDILAERTRRKWLVAVAPKDQNGDEIEDIDTCIVRNADGDEVKQWVALADYLNDSVADRGIGTGGTSARYGEPDGRKTVITGLNLTVMFQHLNKFSFMALAVLVLLLLAAFLLVRKMIKIQRNRRYGAKSRGLYSGKKDKFRF